MKRLFFTMLAGCWVSLAGACGSSSEGAGHSGATVNPAGGTGGDSSGSSGTSSGPTTGTGGNASGVGGEGTGGANTTGGTGGAANGGAAGMGTGGSAVVMGDGGVLTPKTTIVIFLIDGLMWPAVQTAIADGAAKNIKFLLDNGVRVQTAHSSTSAVRVALPDGSQPWGNATSGNSVIVTGTHLLEAPPAGMDDIFKVAHAAGIKSVFSGGDNNYAIYTDPDFHYAETAATDETVVQRAIDHMKNDGVRLLRIHLQRIRDDWSGPAGMTNPASNYILHLVRNDASIGTLIQALKDAGLWDTTYMVFGADHGMGQTTDSVHPPSTASSWDPVLAFYGPGLKKGATIPYAELPDVPVTLLKLAGLPALKGHTDPKVMLAKNGPTGTYLSNLLEGAAADLPSHPRYIEKYLQMGTFTSTGDTFAPYRTGMIAVIK
jgi:hypothetical protein